MNDYGHNWFALVWIAFDAKKNTTTEKERCDRIGWATNKIHVLMMTKSGTHNLLATYSPIKFYRFSAAATYFHSDFGFSEREKNMKFAPNTSRSKFIRSNWIRSELSHDIDAQTFQSITFLQLLPSVQEHRFHLVVCNRFKVHAPELNAQVHFESCDFSTHSISCNVRTKSYQTGIFPTEN